MRIFRPSGFLLWLVLLGGLLISADLVLTARRSGKNASLLSLGGDNLWLAPSEKNITAAPNSRLLLYGRSLLCNTAAYLGPKGTVARISNGMNCQNCHLKGGTLNFANPFSATASTYPKFRDRSGRIETVVFRINDCLKRSLNGQELDSNSAEMKAMVAYIQWVGKDVPKGNTPRGAGVEKLPFLTRAADPEKGRKLFLSTCVSCHGQDGQGQRLPDSSGYLYPPLWGEHSYNVSAGLYRLSSLAGFIKNNMPYGTTWRKPRLSNEQAWDLAAYLVSQPRPEKFFPGDWKNLAKKPVDYPFGPFADTFPERQHQYGPFTAMRRK